MNTGPRVDKTKPFQTPRHVWMDTLNHFKHRAYVWMATLAILNTGSTCGRTPKTFSCTRSTCRRTSKTISKTSSPAENLIQTPHAIFFYRLRAAQFAFWCKIVIQNIKSHFCSQATVGELHDHHHNHVTHYLRPHDRPSRNITT